MPNENQGEFRLARQRAAINLRRFFHTPEVVKGYVTDLPDGVTAKVLLTQNTYRYARKPLSLVVSVGDYVSVLNPGGERSGKWWEILNVIPAPGDTTYEPIVGGYGSVITYNTEENNFTYNTYQIYNVYNAYEILGSVTYNTYEIVGGSVYNTYNTYYTYQNVAYYTYPTYLQIIYNTYEQVYNSYNSVYGSVSGGGSLSYNPVVPFQWDLSGQAGSLPTGTYTWFLPNFVFPDRFDLFIQGALVKTTNNAPDSDSSFDIVYSENPGSEGDWVIAKGFLEVFQ